MSETQVSEHVSNVPLPTVRSVQFTKNVKHFCAQKSSDFLGLSMRKETRCFLRPRNTKYFFGLRNRRIIYGL